jgi:hypothetical protein
LATAPPHARPHAGRTSRIPRAFAPALVCAFVIAALGFAQTAPGAAVLRKLGVAGAPERFTELSFANPNGLPGSAGSRALPVTFRLHDEEGGPRTYDWTVAAASGGAPRALAGGSTRVADGQVVQVRQSVKVPCTTGRTRISVELLKPAESIGFWVDCTRGSGGHG